MTALILTVNSLLLLMAIMIVIGMAQAGTKYTLLIGDSHAQQPLVDRILRGIVVLITIGLLAAFLNLLFG